MKADLHLHSYFSSDSISKPESILRASADNGIGIIAITDHDTTASWKAFQEISHRFPVATIFGQEITVYQGAVKVGELLALFLHTPITSQTITGVIEQVRSQNGLISIPHPFCERRGEFRGFHQISNWDRVAIEVFNSRSYKNENNQLAAKVAEQLKTHITAGSDAHTPSEVGNAYLEFDGKTPEDLYRAIIHHDVVAQGITSSALFSIVSGFGRLGIAI